MNDHPPFDAATRIGVSLAPDVTYFAPANSKNFDPLSIAIGLGGLLLGAFLKGVVTELESGAEAAGQQVGSWLRERVTRLFASEEPRAAHDADDDEAATAAYRDASESDRRRAIEAARATLERLLVDEYDLPPSRVNTISTSVTEEGMRIVALSDG